MKYVLIERQGGGCDYTIGCGIRVTTLKAKDLDSAKEEAANEIGSSWHGKYEGSIDSAEILEVNKSYDLESFLKKKAIEQAEEDRKEADRKQLENDEAELSRLQKKLGKK
jgi:hypothetical protein